MILSGQKLPHFRFGKQMVWNYGGLEPFQHGNMRSEVQLNFQSIRKFISKGIGVNIIEQN